MCFLSAHLPDWKLNAESSFHIRIDAQSIPRSSESLINSFLKSTSFLYVKTTVISAVEMIIFIEQSKIQFLHVYTRISFKCIKNFQIIIYRNFHDLY